MDINDPNFFDSNAPEFDHDQARSEGWDIWDMCEAGNRRFQLQHVQDPSDWHENGWVNYKDPIFSDDSEAWNFVVGKAREGSEYHIGALDYLKEHSPAEYEAICKYEGWEDRPTSSPVA